MGRVDTAPDTTEVIELKTRGDRANHQFVCDPMRRAHPAAEPHPAVSLGAHGARPKKAARVWLGADRCPKPLVAHGFTLVARARMRASTKSSTPLISSLNTAAGDSAAR